MSTWTRSWRLVAAALVLLVPAEAISQEWYTTNLVCQQKYCVNPVFPGLKKLAMLEGTRWIKHSLKEMAPFMKFCPNFVDYDPALPSRDYSNVFNLTAHTFEDIVREQDNEAAKLYFYHLQGMGIEAWEHAYPDKESHLPMQPCARTVARMACFLYFPKANPIVPNGGETRFLPPCRSSCENYVHTCGVECCDGSATAESCVVRNPVVTQGATINSEMQISMGYYDEEGPSDLCTGTAAPGARLAVLSAAAVVGAALFGLLGRQ